MGTGLRSGGLMVRVLVQTNLGGVLAAGDAGELHVCVKRLFYATKRGGDRVNVNLRTVSPPLDQLVSEESAGSGVLCFFHAVRRRRRPNSTATSLQLSRP